MLKYVVKIVGYEEDHILPTLDENAEAMTKIRDSRKVTIRCDLSKVLFTAISQEVLVSAIPVFPIFGLAGVQLCKLFPFPMFVCVRIHDSWEAPYLACDSKK